MDLQGLFNAVDALPPEDYVRLWKHMQARNRSMFAWWVVPPENLVEIREIMRPIAERAAAEMTEDEINEVIDQAIAEVRRERQAKSSD